MATPAPKLNGAAVAGAGVTEVLENGDPNAGAVAGAGETPKTGAATGTGEATDPNSEGAGDPPNTEAGATLVAGLAMAGFAAKLNEATVVLAATVAPNTVGADAGAAVPNTDIWAGAAPNAVAWAGNGLVPNA